MFLRSSPRVTLLGIDRFNRREYHEAHATWEKLWKSIRSHEKRLFLRGLLQLTGTYLNLRAGKTAAAKYLLERSIENIQQYETSLEVLIEVEDLVQQLRDVRGNRLTLLNFASITIRKKEG